MGIVTLHKGVSCHSHLVKVNGVLARLHNTANTERPTVKTISRAGETDKIGVVGHVAERGDFKQVICHLITDENILVRWEIAASCKNLKSLGKAHIENHAVGVKSTAVRRQREGFKGGKLKVEIIVTVGIISVNRDKIYGRITFAKSAMDYIRHRFVLTGDVEGVVIIAIRGVKNLSDGATEDGRNKHGHRRKETEHGAKSLVALGMCLNGAAIGGLDRGF